MSGGKIHISNCDYKYDTTHHVPTDQEEFTLNTGDLGVEKKLCF